MKTFFNKLKINDDKVLFVLFFKYELLPNLYNFEYINQIKKYITKDFKNITLKRYDSTSPRKKINIYDCGDFLSIFFTFNNTRLNLIVNFKKTKQ